MNKGTAEGTEEEIKFIIRLNKNKHDPVWDIILPYTDNSNLYAIHVKGHKYIELLEISISSKADLFIAECNLPESVLIEHNYYLSEDNLSDHTIKYITGTGISVKRIDSERYQISKISPNTFIIVFGNYELGAGASIYCAYPDEFHKNIDVLKGWHTDFDKFKHYFGHIKGVWILDDPNAETTEKLKVAKEIKAFSLAVIRKMILTDNKIWNYVFTGEGYFQEPYCAHWMFERGTFKTISASPFCVTTGSGRSKGVFTVVIKPE